MDYEVFYQSILGTEKNLREKLAYAQRCFKNITKDSAQGDIKKLARDIADMQVLLSDLTSLFENLQSEVEGFDPKMYFETGDFVRQMVEHCKKYDVDIKGEAPLYEMFPFKVRIDYENQDLYINRKKSSCVRPLYFVQEMKKHVEKYTKASFNLERFIQELAAAYDLAVIVRNSKSPSPRAEFDVLLRDLHNYLAPTQKARREYDLQQYAFDLSKLYSSGMDERTKDGRRFELGPSKQTSKLIRILDADGNEQFLGTIRFFA